MLRPLNILLVERDPAHAKPLAAALRKAGHHLLIARDGPHARSIMEYRGFDFVIMGEEESGAGKDDVIACARGLYPRPHVVVTGKKLSPMEVSSVLEKGATLYVKRPVDVDALIKYLARIAGDRHFSGSVDSLDILDYVQLLILSGRETILEVVSNLGTRALLFLKGGYLLHAECGTVRGEEAFYRCMDFKGGTFSHRPWHDPEEITVDRPGDYLLVEAAHRRDGSPAAHEADDYEAHQPES